MRVNWDEGKNALLKRERGIGFVKGKLVTLIVEVREDDLGEYEWLVTLWKSTLSEAKIYEQNS